MAGQTGGTLATLQPSFAAGELSPSLYGRVDLAKYHSGAATLRNFFVNYRGGASTRAGTKYVGTSAQSGNGLPPRIIPFQFSLSQGAVLEFGDHYMCVILNGAYVTSGGSRYTLTTPWGIADVAALKYAQSADVMTLTHPSYSPYDLARVAWDNWTVTEINCAATISPPGTPTVTSSASGSTQYGYVVTAVSAKTGEESVASPVGLLTSSVCIDQAAGWIQVEWRAVAGASSYNIYRAPAGYNNNTVSTGAQMGYVGSALGLSWVDANITPDYTKTPPTHQNPFAAGSIIGVNMTNYGTGYSTSTAGVTVNTSTGSGASFTPIVLGGGVQSVIVTNGGRGYSPSDTVTITPQGGVVATGSLTFVSDGGGGFSINGVVMGDHGSGYSPGTVGYTINGTSGDQTDASITISLSGDTIGSCTITSGGSGYAGTETITFTGVAASGGGATATLQLGALSGTNPSVVGYFQQRRWFANSTVDPNTFWASKTGSFSNMDTAVPVQANDAIVGTIAAQQVNGIQWMVPMPGGLVMLTGQGAWQLSGGSGNGSSVTPSNLDATPQAYNGCNDMVQPIVVNYDILYVQSKGSIARDLSYNFFANIYTGTDMTVLSNHLFDNHTIKRWAWAEEPYKLVWSIRDDGVLLSFTYLKEQDIYAWSRHDTNGLFYDVCVIAEPPVNAPYFVVKRFINGSWVYYIERMDNRLWGDNVENGWCVDSGLALTQPTPNATLHPSTSVPGSVNLAASAAVFSPGDVGKVVRVGGGMATITSYNSGSNVDAILTQPITAVMPNDPTNTPLPADAGAWTMTAPVTTVSGLGHLEGKTVAILADGNVLPNQVVSGGSISLPTAASSIIVGLPFQAQLQSMYLDTGTPTIQGKRKNIYAVTVRMENGRGVKVGTSWSDLVEIKNRSNAIYAGTPIPLYTGDERVIVPTNWQKMGQVIVQQDYPLPVSVLGLVNEYDVGDS